MQTSYCMWQRQCCCVDNWLLFAFCDVLYMMRGCCHHEAQLCCFNGELDLGGKQEGEDLIGEVGVREERKGEEGSREGSESEVERTCLLACCLDNVQLSVTHRPVSRCP